MSRNPFRQSEPGREFLAHPAGAQVYGCNLGKPSYCGKYGGDLCRRWNNAPDVAVACAKWAQACAVCHAEIAACVGHRRPLSDEPICTKCRTGLTACMNRMDAHFWPNRMSGH